MINNWLKCKSQRTKLPHGVCEVLYSLLVGKILSFVLQGDPTRQLWVRPPAKCKATKLNENKLNQHISDTQFLD